VLILQGYEDFNALLYTLLKVYHGKIGKITFHVSF